MLSHDGLISAASTEDAAVYFRVQGFNPAVHHLGETGVVRHFGHIQTVFLQQAEGAAGRQQFNTALAQGAGEFDDSGFVGNTDKGPFYRAR